MYAIVDIETTGGHAAINGITEIAVYVHDGSRVVNHFKTLINPRRKIPYYITALTGISNAMVASAPVFEEVAETIYSLLCNNIFVAHNVNFDFSFVNHHLKKSGYNLCVKKLCTVRLSRKIFTGLKSYSLGHICRHLEIDIEARHRADGDAKATVVLFDKLLQQGAGEHINLMLKKSSGDQWLPLNLDKTDITRLPSKPGVYYFHDKKGKIIYVGKAVNIKKRVSSHFTQNNGEQKRQHFLRLVSKITYTECANELQALILESTKIKKLWPQYNSIQKQPLQKYALYSFEDNRGYLRLAIDKKKKHLPSAYNFNSLHEGQVLLNNMIEEFELNFKLCFLDKTPFTQDDLLLLEPPLHYNQKVNVALKNLEKQLPTFAIIDNGINENENLCLLVERGNFWGMGYLNAMEKIENANDLKGFLTPYTDNDFIRNSIYAYADANPGKKVCLVV